MATRLFVVRHGETEWSRSGRHTGTTDMPLTEAGRAAAEALGARLGQHPFVAVFTSPLLRATDTAVLAGFAEAVPDADLREWDYGAYEGRTTPEIREDRAGWLLWNDGVIDGETIDDVAARADRFIARTRRAGVDGDVLAFAHGHILRVVAARWLEQEPRFGRHLALGPASVSILGWEREVPALEAWNCALHVD